MFFSTNVEQVLTAGKLLGDKNFIYSFHLKLDNFIKFINNIYLLKNTDYFDLLEEQINPQECKNYKFLNNLYLQKKNELYKLGEKYGFNKISQKNNNEIENLKSKISQLKYNPTKENLMEIKQLQEEIKHVKKEIFCAKTPEYLKKEQEVYNLKSKLRQIKNCAVKDPQDIIALCNIVYTMYSLKMDIDELRDVLKISTEDEKKNLYKYLNTKLPDFLKIDCNEETLQKLKLNESKHFNKIFNVNMLVKYDLKNILTLLANDPKSSVTECLNNLPQNRKTKQIFEQNGLNYDLYVNPDKDFALNIEAKRQIAQKDAIIKNITTDIVNLLSSDAKKVSSRYRKIIRSKLEENNFRLVDKNGDIQYNESFCRITKIEPPVTLYRNNNPVNYKDVLDLHKILNTTVSDTTAFLDGSSFELLTFAHHIAILRSDEIDAANYVYPQKNYNLKIKQIDLNDIKHSLFLGNHAHCCTAMGSGINQDTSVKYIKNKFISGIEVLDGSEAIGNTMMFLAKVNDKLSLIIDNIEMASEYQYMDEIRDGIIKYAKMLTARIGHPDIGIYMGVYNSKCDMSKYLFKNYNVEIMGSSGEDKIYLDFIRERIKVDNTSLRTYLYKIK